MKKIVSVFIALTLVLSLCGIFAFAEAENVAAGKSYELNGLRDQYLDDDTKKLTNGDYAASSHYSEPQYVGLSLNSDFYSANGCASIIVDLGESVNVGKVVISLSNHCSAGIGAPSVINVSVSADKSTWSEAVELEYEDLTEAAVVKAIGVVNLTAQYVKYELIASEGNSWMFVDEVEVYNDGEAGEITPPTPDESTPVDESTPANESTPADESAPADESKPANESKPADESTPADSSETEETPEGGNTALWIGLGVVALVVIVAVIAIVAKKKK
ncbi:MAG: discoidin domain-containing protein [Clostridia bacterium]|nr:discoidin domain-containing protein [Clostridia bacterium]